MLHSLAVSSADAFMEDIGADSGSPARFTIYRGVLREGDQTLLSYVDTSWCGPAIAEFATGFAELQRYRHVMDLDPGSLVTQQEAIDALASADRTVAVGELRPGPSSRSCRGNHAVSLTYCTLAFSNSSLRL